MMSQTVMSQTLSSRNGDLRLVKRFLGCAIALVALCLAPTTIWAQGSELRPVVKPDAKASTDDAAQDPADDEKVDPLDAELDRLETGGLGGGDEITRLAGEIRDNMKKIEELLNQKQTGSATQGAQSRTIEQIDELIVLVEKACSSSSSSSGQSQSSEQQEKDQKRGQKQQQISKSERQGGEKEQQKPQSSQKPEDSNSQTRNDRTSEGQLPPEELGDLEERQGRGRWGRLPHTEIEKMYDNGRRKLPEKYRILLEDYFRRLPTDGQ